MSRLRLKKLSLLAGFLVASALTACADVTGPSTRIRPGYADPNAARQTETKTTTEPTSTPKGTKTAPDTASAGLNVWA